MDDEEDFFVFFLSLSLLAIFVGGPFFQLLLIPLGPSRVGHFLFFILPLLSRRMSILSRSEPQVIHHFVTLR